MNSYYPHVETKQEVGKSFDYADYSDIIETGQPHGSKFVGNQDRCNRNGIWMIEFVHTFSQRLITQLCEWRGPDGANEPIVCPK